MFGCHSDLQFGILQSSHPSTQVQNLQPSVSGIRYFQPFVFGIVAETKEGSSSRKVEGNLQLYNRNIARELW